MAQFRRRRRLERGDAAALRVDAAQHVLDRAVLAGRVHALEDDEQRVAGVGVKALVPLLQLLGVFLQRLLVGLLRFVERRDLGRPVRERERLAFGDLQRVDVDLHSRPLLSSRRAILANFLITRSRLSLER